MPDFRAEIRRRLTQANLPPTREAEIVEELSQHLEEQYEDAINLGANEEAAWRAALKDLKLPESLGGEMKYVESVPMGTGRKSNMLADLGQDIRYGLRILAKNPAFTAIAVIALALGIGANSAIFSVVNAILLKPLPYKNPEQLVMIWEEATHLGFPKDTPPPANFLDWREQSTVFDGVAATSYRSFNLTGVGEPERLDGRRVSANLFDILGVKPILGRTFVPEEDKAGTKVVLLSESLWQRRFGGDPSVIGRALNLNGEPYTVIGVLPQTVRLPASLNWRDQVWVPIAFSSEEAANRGAHYLEVIARMKAGVTLPQAQA
jgi:putative ABC transport system permease protein